MSLATLTIIIWSSRVVRFMDYIVQDGAEFLSFFKLTFLVLPSLILSILPLTIFLTTILTYNKLNENSEITILKNCGIKKINLLKPLITLSIIIAVFSYSISLYGSYKSNIAIREIKQEIQNNLSFSMLKDGVFTKFKNLVIYADSKDKNKAHNIMIYKKADPKKLDEKSLIVQAKDAEINENIITLYDGNFQQFETNKNNTPEFVFFKEYDVDLNEITGDQTSFTQKIDSLPTIELFKMIRNYNDYKKEFSNKNKLIYELNYRLSFPIVSIIMAIISGCMMLNGTFSRSRGTKVMIKTAITSIMVYIILLSLYQKVIDSIMFLYILYVVIIAILIYSINQIREKNYI